MKNNRYLILTSLVLPTINEFYFKSCLQQAFKIPNVSQGGQKWNCHDSYGRVKILPSGHCEITFSQRLLYIIGSKDGEGILNGLTRLLLLGPPPFTKTIHI